MQKDKVILVFQWIPKVRPGNGHNLFGSQTIHLRWKKNFFSMNTSKAYLKYIDILFMWLKKLFLHLIFSSWEISTLVLSVKRVKHIHAIFPLFVVYIKLCYHYGDPTLKGVAHKFMRNIMYKCCSPFRQVTLFIQQKTLLCFSLFLLCT